MLHRILQFIVATGAPLAAVPIQHEFIAIDEGLAQLLHIDERQPARNWIVPTGHPQARDLQLIGSGRALVGHDAGYSEFDLATGQRVKDFAAYKGVTSARRLANGHTLLAGAKLAGEKTVVVLELDATDAVTRKTVFPATYVRLLRETAVGTWLMTHDAVVRECDRTGAMLREWAVPGFKNAWKAVRLPDGRTLASGGYGAAMAELDATGTVRRVFATKAELPAATHPHFYATFQLLPNGHIVLANWQGHGPGHGASGAQLFELDAQAQVVWQWSDATIISSLQGVLVLDGLDPAKLHDERTGVMAPVPSP
jgi:hypothetical protein